MSYDAPDFRYDVFSQTITAYGIGYLANPKEVHIIPASAPYEVHLNEIPRGDSPSTLLINVQAGADFEEVSFSTVPNAGQFRAVYGSAIVPPVSIVGQGTVQFNSADAGKTIECAYYGLGSIVQNQFFNQLIEGEYGAPDRVSRAVNYYGDTLLTSRTEEIGVWDMVTNPTLIVNDFTKDRTKVRSVSVLIKDDSNLGVYDLKYAGGVSLIANLGTTLERDTGGLFDAFLWSGVATNRGWITTLYEE